MLFVTASWPAERVFEDVRRAAKGAVYATIDAKLPAADTFFTVLAGLPVL